MNNNYLLLLQQMHAESSPILYFIVFMFAAALATFLNVLLFRMPIIIEQDILDNVKYYLDENGMDSKGLEKERDKYATLMGRSYCPSCGSMIPFYYNIPVFGWLMLRGKSACCKQKIPARYFLVEFLYSLLSCFAVWHFGLIEGVGISLFAYLAIAIADIDFKIKLIPDEYTYILLWLGLALNINATYTDLSSAVVGVIAVYSAIYMISYIYTTVRGIEGMGQGDFKLFAAIAAWVGLSQTLYVVALSCLIGMLMFLFFGIKNKGSSKDNQAEIPFAPAIVMAGMIVLCFF